MGHSTVMLSAAKHLDAQRDKALRFAQGDTGGSGMRTALSC